jgi:hypothetical protein
LVWLLGLGYVRSSAIRLVAARPGRQQPQRLLDGGVLNIFIRLLRIGMTVCSADLPISGR